MVELKRNKYELIAKLKNDIAHKREEHKELGSQLQEALIFTEQRDYLTLANWKPGDIQPFHIDSIGDEIASKCLERQQEILQEIEIDTKQWLFMLSLEEFQSEITKPEVWFNLLGVELSDTIGVLSLAGQEQYQQTINRAVAEKVELIRLEYFFVAQPLQFIEAYKSEIEAGNRMFLEMAIMLCKRRQLSLPSWLSTKQEKFKNKPLKPGRGNEHTKAIQRLDDLETFTLNLLAIVIKKLDRLNFGSALIANLIGEYQNISVDAAKDRITRARKLLKQKNLSENTALLMVPVDIASLKKFLHSSER